VEAIVFGVNLRSDLLRAIFVRDRKGSMNLYFGAIFRLIRRALIIFGGLRQLKRRKK
jgi:hypothetical protein